MLLAGANMIRFYTQENRFNDLRRYRRMVMEQLGITTPFAFDHHFKQFGTIQVVP
jgi:predicted nucleic acid-binding protein